MRKFCFLLLACCMLITGCNIHKSAGAEDNKLHTTPEVTEEITIELTDEPMITEIITVEPTEVITNEPTEEPTDAPSEEPTENITSVPTDTPQSTPTVKPTNTPRPTVTPSPVPTATPKPTPKPTPTPTPKPTWTETEIEPKTLYTTHSLNIRTAPYTGEDNVIYCMPKGAKVKAIAETNNGWYKIEYKDYVGYSSKKYLSTQQEENLTYPLVYQDSTMKITIYKEWYHYAYIYSAHIVTTDYTRIGMYNANNKYHSYCTTSQAAKQLGAILCVNGDYANAPCFGLAFARRGKVFNDGECYAVGFYNNHTGILYLNGSGTPTYGRKLSKLVEEGLVTDTINFYYSVFVKNGQNLINPDQSNSTDRRPRTFIGTNGNPGDIWIFVADGDHRDGKSVGINSWERADWAISKGCTLCFGMDGGGSSTMVFQGKRLTGGNHSERAVVDFFFAK